MPRMSRLTYYVLDKDHRVVPVRDVIEWGQFFEIENRLVANSEFECGVSVSTVFLGIDHRFHGNGPPLVFETMVFEMTAEGDGDQWRYSSWDDAEAGHKAAVRRVKAQLAKAGLSIAEIADERN